MISFAAKEPAGTTLLPDGWIFRLPLFTAGWTNSGFLVPKSRIALNVNLITTQTNSRFRLCLKKCRQVELANPAGFFRHTSVSICTDLKPFHASDSCVREFFFGILNQWECSGRSLSLFETLAADALRVLCWNARSAKKAVETGCRKGKRVG